jgi:transposase-like protein
MQRKNYSAEFKEQAQRKAQERGAKTLQNIADELNLNLGTLKNWLKQSGKDLRMAMPAGTPANSWTAAQRLAALNESHGLKDQGLRA